MRSTMRNLAICFMVGQLAFGTETVSPEERKAEFAKPRGLSQRSSATRESTAQPASASTSANEVYQKMGQSFSKEIETLTKNFSLPKTPEEPNFLNKLEEARKTLDSAKDQFGNSKASLIAQYTEAFIETLNELAQMQFERETSQLKKSLETPETSNPSVNPNHLNPSPISIRTPLSSPSGNGRGLFPSELDSLSSNAYNPPK